MSSQNESHLSNHQRAKLIFHSFIVIGIGLIGGMAWVIALAGHLELWPIPPIELDLPETKELWRNAHLGPIMNGIFVLAIAGISPFLTLSAKATKALFYLSIIMLWGNTLGYQTAPFASDRGLGVTGDAMNIFCYACFYIAAICALVVVWMGIYGSYKTMSLHKI